MYDCWFFKNFYWDESFRVLNGCDLVVGVYILEDFSFVEFFEKFMEIMFFFLLVY